MLSLVAAESVGAMTALLQPGDDAVPVEIELRHGNGSTVPVLVGRAELNGDGERLTCSLSPTSHRSAGRWRSPAD